MEHARLSTSRLSGRLPETSGIAGCLQAKRGSPAKQTATLLLLPRDTALGPWLRSRESFETQDVWNKISVIQQIGHFSLKLSSFVICKILAWFWCGISLN